MTSLKRFNLYEIFYDMTRKGWPFNTGDYLIKVAVYIFTVTNVYMHIE
jgi:hypothetical protein